MYRSDEFATYVDHFACQITDLENEISKRKQINEREAKIFHDHLTSVYEKLKATETESQTCPGNNLSPSKLSKLRRVFMKVINLKLKLTEMSPITESMSSTEAKAMIKSISTKQPDIEKILQRQNFFTRQIESLEVQADICSTKAEVMYDHVSELYNCFVSNQIQIEENVDDGATLEIQQNIATDVQAKVIDFQTKLMKIIKSIPTTSISQPDVTNVNSEIRSSPVHKTSFQPEQTQQSSESENTLRSMDLKLSKLESLYKDLLDSQEDRYDDETSTNNSEILDSLNDNLEVSNDIKNKMACLEEAQHELREGNERSEKKILDKLNQILQMNRSQNSKRHRQSVDNISVNSSLYTNSRYYVPTNTDF